MEFIPFLCAEWHHATNLSTKSTTNSELLDVLGCKQCIYILFMTWHTFLVFCFVCFLCKKIFFKQGNSSWLFKQFLSPCLSTVPRIRLLYFMINYHLGMRMMAFYSPQSHFLSNSNPMSLSQQASLPWRSHYPQRKFRSSWHSSWIAWGTDSKPYGHQVWKFIRTPINNNKKLALNLHSW